MEQRNGLCETSWWVLRLCCWVHRGTRCTQPASQGMHRLSSSAFCCYLFRSGWKHIVRPKSFEETWPSLAPRCAQSLATPLLSLVKLPSKPPGFLWSLPPAAMHSPRTSPQQMKAAAVELETAGCYGNWACSGFA